MTLIDKNHYKHFFEDIKRGIQSARVSAAKSVNKELIKLYLHIGQQIVEKQEEFRWGKSVVEILASDLQKEFENTDGFSARNLWNMRMFYLQYRNNEFLLQAVAEIPWGHNLLIMNKITDQNEREYYIKATIENGWSRNVLGLQIKSNAYQRHMLTAKQHNFEKALPEHLAEQADQTMKDVYMLDFLGITQPVLERVLEAKMVEKIKELILELGYGFAFIGNQYKISSPTKDYFIDLLFYHRKLKCLVAFELKAGEFKAEFAGKMNLYLNILDDFVREKDENPSIGIILCAEKENFEVEYAIKGFSKPMGVAEYKLTKELPSEFKGTLPTPQELKKELFQKQEK
jgi:predicted nuclease of restriction endonuclease-like (RecB) superfamily